MQLVVRGLARLIMLALIMATGISGRAATRLFVLPFTGKTGSTELRNELVNLLKRQKSVQIVESVVEADRILSGSGETYVKGYLGKNPRVRYRNSDSRAVYGGYLSVELTDKDGEPLWSYLATPRRFDSDINRNLASQIVVRLVGLFEGSGKTAGP